VQRIGYGNLKINRRLPARPGVRAVCGLGLLPLLPIVLLAAAGRASAAAPVPTASALPTGVVTGATTGGWNVTYDGFAHGLLVLKMRATLGFTQTGYSGALSFHTAGMVGWMIHDTDDSEVHGRFVQADPSDPAPDRADPMDFVSIGNLRGVDRVTRMTYKDGAPVIQTLTPDPKLERSAVPPEATPHTLDNLSAIAMLVRQVADTGRCDGGGTLFDGRRLTTLSARTSGTQMLAPTNRSIFAGQALRCDFDGTQLYGFKNDESQVDQRRTKHGNAWLASLLPHQPPVPVRVIFTNKALGEVTLYLTAATAAPGAVAQLPGTRVQ
jgi:hypothetical protein